MRGVKVRYKEAKTVFIAFGILPERAEHLENKVYLMLEQGNLAAESIQELAKYCLNQTEFAAVCFTVGMLTMCWALTETYPSKTGGGFNTDYIIQSIQYGKKV